MKTKSLKESRKEAALCLVPESIFEVKDQIELEIIKQYMNIIKDQEKLAIDEYIKALYDHASDSAACVVIDELLNSVDIDRILDK